MKPIDILKNKKIMLQSLIVLCIFYKKHLFFRKKNGSINKQGKNLILTITNIIICAVN